jgi:hypothetical protein
MKPKRFATLLGGVALFSGAAATFAATGDLVVATDAYSWRGDTLYQDEFKAWAVSPEEIHSTYKGRPGYFMPIEQTWKRKNDLSAYPVLTGGNPLMQAVYNMGLDEMVNAVEPDTTLRTGKEWAGVWTRDVSYSIILSMAALQPEASMISLLKKVNPEGQIIQDTGSGGAWPISTDRMIWTLAAWEIYKVTGDKKWLEKVYPVVVNSLAKDKATVMSANGLVKGETSFIDWREQSYPKWMQTVDISQSEAMGTNVLYAAALGAASEMASVLGKKKEAAQYKVEASALSQAIDKTFWMPDKGYYGMYTYGRDNKILNPRAETLGEALAILYDVAPAERQKSISQNNPTTKFGPAIFYPQIADMPNYHNNALWPFVASYWALAQAKAGNEQGALEGIGSVIRPAALFATNKENFNLDNGDIFTELNSSNMLWSLAGNLALTNRMLFGINFEKNGIRFAPFIPEALAGERTLSNFPYRGARLNITVNGFGNRMKSITINGKSYYPETGKVYPAKLFKGDVDIRIEMDNEPIPPMQVNHVANSKAPLTPIAWIAAEDTPGALVSSPKSILEWNPIEYIAEYIVLRDGKEVARTRETSYPLDAEGEWQVIGVASDGTLSFASEPRSNRTRRVWEMNGEKKAMTSSEVSYQPKGGVEGWHGGGFAEADQTAGAVTATIDTPADAMPAGEYTISFRYANGNGPVNTENKAAIRSLYVDGEDVGTIVMPQRGVGNWNDWGTTNTVRVNLAPGRHEVRLVMNPEDKNMNLKTNHAIIDRIIVEKVSD